MAQSVGIISNQTLNAHAPMRHERPSFVQATFGDRPPNPRIQFCVAAACALSGAMVAALVVRGYASLADEQDTTSLALISIALGAGLGAVALSLCCAVPVGVAGCVVLKNQRTLRDQEVQNAALELPVVGGAENRV